ncbi:MAG: guanylate kinase [Bacteroidetes bacterium]|nr:guanylate kinase [Bacteroidota bacterium]
MNKIQLFAISSPSGGGKTTIVKEVLRRHPELLFSVSATTRKKRKNEVEGKDYFFKSKDEFLQLIKNKELIEVEELFGNYYGTLLSEVDRALKNGSKMIFDIDVKGALSIKKKYPKNSKLIFIKPPDIETLKNRLRDRKTETEEDLKIRLQRISLELNKAKKFDKTIINDKLENAINQTEEEIK